MRHHDIERLKLAAGRIAMGIELLTDIEDVCEYAVDKLDEPSGVHKVDNGDGTVTIRGLPVTIPSTLIPEGEVPIEVRSLFNGTNQRLISSGGAIRPDGISGGIQHKGDLRILLADKPQPVTWIPPVSLPGGEYVWKEGELWNCHSKRMIAHVTIEAWLGADFTVPPKEGRYRKDGTIATWIGEA